MARTLDIQELQKATDAFTHNAFHTADWTDDGACFITIMAPSSSFSTKGNIIGAAEVRYGDHVFRANSSLPTGTIEDVNVYVTRQKHQLALDPWDHLDYYPKTKSKPEWFIAFLVVAQRLYPKIIKQKTLRQWIADHISMGFPNIPAEYMANNPLIKEYKPKVSHLPPELQNKIANMTLTVKNRTIEDMNNVIDLKLKNSMFRNVDIVPQMIDIFNDGKWESEQHTSRQSEITWYSKQKSKTGGDIFAIITTIDAPHERNRVTLESIEVQVLDERGDTVKSSKFKLSDHYDYTTGGDTTMYYKNGGLNKGWIFAFLVAAQKKYPKILTQTICMRFMNAHPEAEVFTKLMVFPSPKPRQENTVSKRTTFEVQSFPGFNGVLGHTEASKKFLGKTTTKGKRSKVPPTISKKTLRSVLPRT